MTPRRRLRVTSHAHLSILEDVTDVIAGNRHRRAGGARPRGCPRPRQPAVRRHLRQGIAYRSEPLKAFTLMHNQQTERSGCEALASTAMQSALLPVRRDSDLASDSPKLLTWPAGLHEARTNTQIERMDIDMFELSDGAAVGLDAMPPSPAFAFAARSEMRCVAKVLQCAPPSTERAGAVTRPSTRHSTVPCP
jgi:hypothetical protein